MSSPYPLPTFPRSPRQDWHKPLAGSEPPPERIPRPGGWLRFDAGWLAPTQAVKNLETAVSLLQTAGAAVEDIDALISESLLEVNSLWANGDRTRPPPAAAGHLLRERLRQVDELARQCRFHGRGLLDGQSGVAGLGRGAEFIRGGPNTAAAPPEGFEVRIQAQPTRAAIVGGVMVHEDWLAAETEIFLAEGENHIRYRPQPGNAVPETLARLQEHLHLAGLDLEVGLTRQKRLIVRHNQYGSQFKFKGSSQKTPLLSKRPGKPEWSRRGRDVQGTLDGESAFGIGRMLVGYLDNTRTSELAVLWRGGASEDGRTAWVHVAQNGIAFQEGQESGRPPVRLTLPALQTRNLGRWLECRSGFRSLADLRLEAWPQVQDALNMLFAVSCELDDWRDRIREWIVRFQNQALTCLRRGISADGPPRMSNGQARQAEEMARTLRDLIRSGPGAVG